MLPINPIIAKVPNDIETYSTGLFPISPSVIKGRAATTTVEQVSDNILSVNIFIILQQFFINIAKIHISNKSHKHFFTKTHDNNTNVTFNP